MSEYIQGPIESMARNRKSIKVDGDWFSVYSPKQLEGVEWKDTVEFEYDEVEKGGATFRNIKGNVTMLEQGEEHDKPKDRPAQRQSSSSRSGGRTSAASSGYAKDAGGGKFDTQRAIVRQNSATQANAVVASAVAAGALPEGLDYGDLTELVLQIARKFEQYAMGEID